MTDLFSLSLDVTCIFLGARFNGVAPRARGHDAGGAPPKYEYLTQMDDSLRSIGIRSAGSSVARRRWEYQFPGARRATRQHVRTRRGTAQLPRRYRATAFTTIKPCRLGEVKFSAQVKRIAQASSARSRASASGPDTGEDSPRSISASRRAANSSQALSRALSASRLAMTRSSSLARSDVGRRRSSISRVSTVSVMAETLWRRCRP